MILSSVGFFLERRLGFRGRRSRIHIADLAVRLPKDVAFPEGVKEVTILREGARRIIVPSNALWDDFFDAAGIDLPERKQPPVQQRESF